MRHFFRNAAPLLAALAGGPAVALAQWFVFHYAPVEEHMKLTQKIFYLHLPLAWWALISFTVVFAASVAYLRTKNARWEILADSAAETGVLFASLTLATGVIWSRAVWWQWWLWEYRLTATLVMWFIYAAYLVLRGLEMPRGRRAAVKAALGIAAFLDVPLVFFATRLWRSHHPVGVMSAGDGLEPEMRLAVFVCLAATGLFWLALLLCRCRLAGLEERLAANSRRIFARR